MLSDIKGKINFKKSKNNTFLSKSNFIFLFIVLFLTIVFSPSNKLEWVGVALAMFSTMSNDSIQTLGTFITSNSKVSWWKLSLYIVILFVITIVGVWFFDNGRIDFNRLDLIPYQDKSNIVHFIPPILLIILTYYKIPASTTFLILSVFASQQAMGAILVKTITGYFLGFAFSYIIWTSLLKFLKIFLSNSGSEKRMKKWKKMQWLSTGILWVSWLANNTSNIAVYLPRRLYIYDLILFLLIGIAYDQPP